MEPTVPYMDVSKNRGTPKSSILIGFSFINHPFWGTLICGNTHIMFQPYKEQMDTVKHHGRLSSVRHTFVDTLNPSIVN